MSFFLLCFLENIMNTDTITVSRDTAIQTIADIKALKKSQRSPEDDALLSLYTSVAKHGARVLTLSAAFRQAGLNELGQPRIAIAQADWLRVSCGRVAATWNRMQDPANFGLLFEDPAKWRSRVGKINLPAGCFTQTPTDKALTTPVPYVPAKIRPKFHLRNYHVLFEVEEWTVEMQRDPFLLKHIMGETYAVIAEWELTELEAQLIGGMRRGGNR